jgi:hypothetical protein
MLLYAPDKYFGNDRIVMAPDTLSGEVGDLLLISGQYFLVLGGEAARGCDYEMESPGDVHIAEQ